MDFYNTFTCMYFVVFSRLHILVFLSDASSKTFEAIYQTPRSCLRFEVSKIVMLNLPSRYHAGMEYMGVS